MARTEEARAAGSECARLVEEAARIEEPIANLLD